VPMKPGKLPNDALSKMLARLPGGDPRVIVGPGVGEDAAVIEWGDRLLVAKTDPITFASDLIGWYAVHVNANDIAAMGGEPRWFMATLLLPENLSEKDVSEIMDQIAEAARQLDVTVVGGHTEITLGLDRPIVVGCMLGETTRERLVTSAGASPGDTLILGGHAAIEGTALLAREAAEALLAAGVGADALAQARGLLLSPGISVVAAARAAVEAGGVTALHDPTEGGLATGIRELATASGVGMEVRGDDIAVLPVSATICDALSLDLLGVISSGALLVAARPEAAERIVSAIRGEGSVAHVIGVVTAPEDGLWLRRGRSRRRLPEFARDEVARFFEREEAGLP